MFKRIKDIEINSVKSWEDKIFLTFDIDWCSDEVLSYTLDIVEKSNIKATFFVTHKSKLLKRMHDNPNIELGIHPNFNPLLNGDFRYGKNIREVIEYYNDILPQSVSIRSHSLTTNSTISQLLKRHGLRYECNQLIPENSKIIVKPYKHWESDLIAVPHFWEDDVHCIYKECWDVDRYLNYKGIKVFDFHPIHIFLNSEKLERYESAIEYFYNDKQLKEFRNHKAMGANDMLNQIIEKIKGKKSE
jgi:hypothetical protein